MTSGQLDQCEQLVLFETGARVVAADATVVDATVFVVDEHAASRLELEKLLEGAGFGVTSFGTASEFLASYRQDLPACLVLDVHLPEVNGLELQEQLLAHDAFLPMVCIARCGEVSMCVRTRQLGSVGFWIEPLLDAELVAAVSQALGLAQRDWQERARLREIRSRLALLTRRERQVLEHVVSGARNKQIAQVLGISEVTVKAHRAQVMQKLHASSLPDVVRMAGKVGIDTKV